MKKSTIIMLVLLSSLLTRFTTSISAESQKDENNEYRKQRNSLLSEQSTLVSQSSAKFTKWMDKLNKGELSFEKFNNLVETEYGQQLDKLSKLLIELKSLTPSSSALVKNKELTIKGFEEGIESAKKMINKDFNAAADQSHKAAKYFRQAAEEAKKDALEIMKKP